MRLIGSSRLAAAGLALLLGACAGTAPLSDAPEATKPAARATPPALALPKVAPADLGVTVQLNQHLRIARGAEQHEIDAVLAVGPDRIKLAAFGMGVRLITVSYDGERITEQRHPLLPAAVDGERILRDLVLTYWPQAAVQARLPQGWQVAESGPIREVSWQGQTVLRITYDAAPRWAGRARLQNVQHGYELLVASTEN